MATAPNPLRVARELHASRPQQRKQRADEHGRTIHQGMRNRQRNQPPKSQIQPPRPAATRGMDGATAGVGGRDRTLAGHDTGRDRRTNVVKVEGRSVEEPGPGLCRCGSRRHRHRLAPAADCACHRDGPGRLTRLSACAGVTPLTRAGSREAPRRLVPARAASAVVDKGTK